MYLKVILKFDFQIWTLFKSRIVRKILVVKKLKTIILLKSKTCIKNYGLLFL